MGDLWADKPAGAPAQSQLEDRRGGSHRHAVTLGKLMVICFFAMTVTGLLALLIVYILDDVGILSTVTNRHAYSAITLLVGILVGAVISFLLIAFLVHPVKEFTDATKRVREGDYSVRVREQEQRGELSELQRSFNQMVEELQSTEIFRNDFINDFSHEFKTPIVSIRGFAGEMLKGDITEEQRQEYSQIIYDESQRLANLSSGILLLTKLEAQQFVSERMRVDLAEMIRRCILLLQNQWEAKDLVIEPLLCEAEILCDPHLLSEVWLNLLNNAIKFSPIGGTVKVYSVLQGDTVEVAVGDEGPGMDEETASRVFEKFYQGDASRASMGNGIGLSLVKRIVELHGGRVELDTAPGIGSIFAVILPVG